MQGGCTKGRHRGANCVTRLESGHSLGVGETIKQARKIAAEGPGNIRFQGCRSILRSEA